MNEELKIIISAVTENAKKGIKEVNGSLSKLGKEGAKVGANMGKAMSKMGKATLVAAGAAIAGISAISAAFVNLAKNSADYRKEQAKLNTAFAAMGASSQTASKTFNDLFRFMGESDTAVEAAGHLAKLTTDEKELAEWTTALQGVYATFGDSIPIEGLTEAANETAKVGKVTGTLADALNWAGVSEDAFNVSLAQCSTEQERQAVIRNTLNGLYSDAAAIYEKNNADIIAANEAQARLDATTAQLGKTVQPLLTALLNLSSSLLVALAPAIQIVTNALVYLINIATKAVNAIAKFFGISSGTSASVESGFAGVATGATDISTGLGQATKQAEKLKRATAGFDELNVMGSGSSGSSGSSGGNGGGAGAGAALPSGGNILDTSGLDAGLDASGGKFGEFIEKIKSGLAQLKEIFAPTVEGFKTVFSAVGDSFNNALPNFISGFESIVGGFSSILSYLWEVFIPNVVNGFSENFAPIYAEWWPYLIEELGRTFAWLGDLFNSVATEILIPLMDSISMVWVDVCEMFSGAWDNHGGRLIGNLTTFFENVRELITDIYEGVIAPVWAEIVKAFDTLWNETLSPYYEYLVDTIFEIINCIFELYNGCIAPIVNWIATNIYPLIVKYIELLLKHINNVYKDIAGIVKGTVQIIKGIVQFITGVFTGDWEKAWEGVKNIFVGIWDTLVSYLKLPINYIISYINVAVEGIVFAANAAIRAINKLSFTIPDWVPVVGGEKFGFNIKELTAPKIPMLAKGGIVTSETLARIGEGGKKEAVLPLEQNTDWMDKLADKIASRNSSPSKIVLMLDGKELGWASINSINSITKQTGNLQLSLV